MAAEDFSCKGLVCFYIHEQIPFTKISRYDLMTLIYNRYIYIIYTYYWNPYTWIYWKPRIWLVLESVIAGPVLREKTTRGDMGCTTRSLWMAGRRFLRRFLTQLVCDSLFCDPREMIYPEKTLKHIWKQHTQIDMNIYMIFIYNIWYMGELYWCHLTFLEMNEGCFEVNPWPSMSGNGMVKCHNSSMPKCVVYTLTYVVRYIYIHKCKYVNIYYIYTWNDIFTHMIYVYDISRYMLWLFSTHRFLKKTCFVCLRVGDFTTRIWVDVSVH